MRFRRITLRTRLTASAVAGSAITLATLITAFNLVLDARLRTDADNLLHERAATVLRGLGTVDGRLSVIEAPDQAAIDAQTWIFAGERALEQPAGVDPRNQQAARGIARMGSGFTTVDMTDTRLHAVPVRQAARRLGTVVVGASVAPYESTASSARLGSLILGLLTLAAIAVLSRWLISRALRPVAQMTAQAADWGEHDYLSRRFFFAGEPHDELSALASVFDGLLTRLAQSLRREQRLTAEVSHELRTPLAKVLAESELATSRDRPSREYRASLKLIRSYAQDLQRVLETLLASARAAVSGGTEASDARASAQRAAAPLHETLVAQGKSIELVCTQPLRVAVEADVVERILSPLLENAARFAREQIVLDIRAADGEVVFEIRDDGPGVDPRDRERIFDAGFRNAKPHTETHVGAGLGLPLARRLARAAGGEVEARVSSDGASFAVRLPTS
ncbi:MAG TPA: HAMP domain-containing sensor histidine kinase [Solirubrobacteraceae bacterium]|jgi:signal transduction histidine kinase|nr:HAMP domain-containing sensor histidine kinase [Solirubrobacteraceae bacterium]